MLAEAARNGAQHARDEETLQQARGTKTRYRIHRRYSFTFKEPASHRKS